MKTIICGGRDYILTPEDYGKLETLLHRIPITEVVTGGATGADTCGREWAEGKGIKSRVFRALWKIHGKSAGHIRNSVMRDYADACIVFPGGDGTDDMARKMKAKAGAKVFDLRGDR